MKYFDVHTHTNYSPLESHAKEIADECLQKNIYYVDIGTNVDTSLIAVKHSISSPNVYACVGIHPNDISNIDFDIAINEIETMVNGINKNKIVAIGETGLDYHYQNYDKQKQTEAFIKHIQLAKKYNLPLMVHVREAHDDTIAILKEHAKDIKIIIHCFSGDIKLVQEYTSIGCYFSINGIIGFKNAEELRTALPTIPFDLLLSETDAPWLSPEPNRGGINTPLNIPTIVEQIANVLKKDVIVVANQLFSNALSLFNIKIDYK